MTRLWKYSFFTQFKRSLYRAFVNIVLILDIAKLTAPKTQTTNRLMIKDINRAIPAGMNH